MSPALLCSAASTGPEVLPQHRAQAGKSSRKKKWPGRSFRDWTGLDAEGSIKTHQPTPGSPRPTSVHSDKMALNPSRSAFASTCTGLRRCSAPAHSVAHCRLSQPARQLSSSAARNNDPFSVLTETVERQPQPGKRQPQPVERQAELQQHERPRWSYTPERMKGPGFSLNIVKDPRRTIWRNNDDPAKVDAMYNRLLGTNGEKMLPDEIKWLAITHKSFDQGRRGFNTRLAYFGASQACWGV